MSGRLSIMCTEFPSTELRPGEGHLDRNRIRFDEQCLEYWIQLAVEFGGLRKIVGQGVTDHLADFPGK